LIVSHSAKYVLAATLLWACACTAEPDNCGSTDGISLQVLGSGGPIADDARSSTAYLIWIDGRSRVLVDAGGGTFLRFGEAGASFADLEHVAISHFHTDHSADLVTLLKSGYFSGRTRSLGVSGPGAGGPFPGLADFLDHSVGENGAYAYLSGYLDGSGGLARLQLDTVAPSGGEIVRVFGDDESSVTIEATSVPHGIVPALAYRVRAGNKLIVFSGDQNGNDERFVEFARDAHVLVMHMPVPEDISGAGRKLHAPPSRIGEIAAAADVQLLLISHFMARSLRDIDANTDAVQRAYNGQVILAEDLQCIRVDS